MSGNTVGGSRGPSYSHKPSKIDPNITDLKAKKTDEQSKASQVGKSASPEAKEKKTLLQKASNFFNKIGNFFYKLSHGSSSENYTPLGLSSGNVSTSSSNSMPKTEQSIRRPSLSQKDTTTMSKSDVEQIKKDVGDKLGKINAKDSSTTELIDTMKALISLRNEIDTLQNNHAELKASMIGHSPLHNHKLALNSKLNDITKQLTKNLEGITIQDNGDIESLTTAKKELLALNSALGEINLPEDSLKQTKTTLEEIKSTLQEKIKSADTKVLEKINSLSVSTNLDGLTHTQTKLNDLHTQLKDYPHADGIETALNSKSKQIEAKAMEFVDAQLGQIKADQSEKASDNIQVLQELQTSLDNFYSVKPETDSFGHEHATLQITKTAKNIATKFNTELTALSGGNTEDATIAQGQSIVDSGTTQLADIAKWIDTTQSTLQTFKDLNKGFSKLDTFQAITGQDLTQGKQVFEGTKTSKLPLAEKAEALTTQLTAMNQSLLTGIQQKTQDQVDATKQRVHTSIKQFTQGNRELNFQKVSAELGLHFAERLNFIKDQMNSDAIGLTLKDDQKQQLTNLYLEKEFKAAFTTFVGENYNTTDEEGKWNGGQRSNEQIDADISKLLGHNTQAKEKADKFMGGQLKGSSQIIQKDLSAYIISNFANQSLMSNLRGVSTFTKALEGTMQSLTQSNVDSPSSQQVADNLDQMANLHNIAQNYATFTDGYINGYNTDQTISLDKLEGEVRQEVEKQFSTPMRNMLKEYIKDRLDYKKYRDKDTGSFSTSKLENKAFRADIISSDKLDFKHKFGEKGLYQVQFDQIKDTLATQLQTELRKNPTMTDSQLDDIVDAVIQNQIKTNINTLESQEGKALLDHKWTRAVDKGILTSEGTISNSTRLSELKTDSTKKDPKTQAINGSQANKTLGPLINKKLDAMVQAAEKSRGLSSSVDNMQAEFNKPNTTQLIDDGKLKLNQWHNKFRTSPMVEKVKMLMEGKQSIDDAISTLTGSEDIHDTLKSDLGIEELQGNAENMTEIGKEATKVLDEFGKISEQISSLTSPVGNSESSQSGSSPEDTLKKLTEGADQAKEKLEGLLKTIAKHQETILSTVDGGIDMVSSQVPYLNIIVPALKAINNIRVLAESHHAIGKHAQALATDNNAHTTLNDRYQINSKDSNKTRTDTFATMLQKGQTRNKAALDLLKNSLNAASGNLAIGSKLKFLHDLASISTDISDDDLKSISEHSTTIDSSLSNIETSNRDSVIPRFVEQLKTGKFMDSTNTNRKQDAFEIGRTLQQYSGHLMSQQETQQHLQMAIAQ